MAPKTLTFNAGDTFSWYLVEAPTGASTYNVYDYQKVNVLKNKSSSANVTTVVS